MRRMSPGSAPLGKRLPRGGSRTFKVKLAVKYVHILTKMLTLHTFVRVSEAISRLAQDPSQEPVVDALRRILKKQQRRALSASTSRPNPVSSASVIDLTE